MKQKPILQKNPLRTFTGYKKLLSQKKCFRESFETQSNGIETIEI